jgi:hypothetical protein
MWRRAQSDGDANAGGLDELLADMGSGLYVTELLGRA